MGLDLDPQPLQVFAEATPEMIVAPFLLIRAKRRRILDDELNGGPR
jgi:hypothetical protein